MKVKDLIEVLGMLDIEKEIYIKSYGIYDDIVAVKKIEKQKYDIETDSLLITETEDYFIY